MQNKDTRREFSRYIPTRVSSCINLAFKRILCVLNLFVCLIPNVYGNEQDTTDIASLTIDLPIFDLPFLQEAAGTGQVFNSFSMQQSLAVTQNLHRVNYHLNNQFWNKIIHPDSRRKKIYNRIAANATTGLIDYVFTYYGVALSAQWLHEEFHRNGLTLNGIPSYNETYNRFNGGFANGSVSRVRDEDMIRFKRVSPQELVRSFSAGIESELELLRGLQKDNFFDRSNYANVLFNILLTKHAVDYVNQFKRADYNASIDSMNTHGSAIADRDFVGWDFTPWVYDLHRPDEDYEARGVHPSGVGIDRAIKSSSLSPEEYTYLKKMGNMQYLNFISPFMLGINRIRINESSSFNFALRHYLNSFGYDLSADLFLDLNGKHYLLTLHGYSNKYLFLPGIEAELPALKIKRPYKNSLTFQPGIMLWLQPGTFFAARGKPGGLFRIRTNYEVNKRWHIYANMEAKSKGWVAGHPYLDANFGIRTGITARFGKIQKAD
jgi:hypothetical protein